MLTEKKCNEQNVRKAVNRCCLSQCFKGRILDDLFLWNYMDKSIGWLINSLKQPYDFQKNYTQNSRSGPLFACILDARRVLVLTLNFSRMIIKMQIIQLLNWLSFDPEDKVPIWLENFNKNTLIKSCIYLFIEQQPAIHGFIWQWEAFDWCSFLKEVELINRPLILMAT